MSSNYLQNQKKMFIATGTDSTGKLKVVLRAKGVLMMLEYSDGQSYFHNIAAIGGARRELDKETNTEKIYFNTGRPQADRFPVGTFVALANAVYDFGYETLVPDTNITVSEFEKMQKEAADMKKEIEHLKTTSAAIKQTKRSTRASAKDTQEVDLLTIEQVTNR
jgi:hypothetical protein